MLYFQKLALIIACVLVATSKSEAAVTLTTFGTTLSPTFAIDSDNTGFTTVQGGSSLQISGSDLTGTLAGGINSVSILGDSNLLTLTGSTTAAPGGFFSVTLFDASGHSAKYLGGTWTGLSTGATSLTYSNADSTPGFDFAHVIGIGLNPSGSGNNINATLTGLSAGITVAPEPSRVMLGFLGLGLLALRRRR